MPDLSARLHLCVSELTTDWQEYRCHIKCRAIELTADKEWQWCTSTEKPEVVRTIPAFQREKVIESWDKYMEQDQAIFYFKGVEQGKIWDKCVR